jgi:hypothetical protein
MFLYGEEPKRFRVLPLDADVAGKRSGCAVFGLADVEPGPKEHWFQQP